MGEGKTEIDSCLQCPLHCLFMLWKIFIIESTKRKHMSMQCTCLCVLVTVAPFSMVLFGFWEAKGKETQRKSSFRSRLTNKFHCLGQALVSLSLLRAGFERNIKQHTKNFFVYCFVILNKYLTLTLCE